MLITFQGDFPNINVPCFNRQMAVGQGPVVRNTPKWNAPHYSRSKWYA